MTIASVTRNITVTIAEVLVVDIPSETFSKREITVIGRIPKGKELEYFKHTIDTETEGVVKIGETRVERVQCSMPLIDFYNTSTKRIKEAKNN